jgi:hypothetical protein
MKSFTQRSAELRREHQDKEVAQAGRGTLAKSSEIRIKKLMSESIIVVSA